MNRKSLMPSLSLLAKFVSTAMADTVKNVGWGVTYCLKVLNLDPSTYPPTPLQDVGFALQDARSGTPPNPPRPLATVATVRIVNLDPLGIGDAAIYDFIYIGPARRLSRARLSRKSQLEKEIHHETVTSAENL